jgi:hypothetical protein
MTIQNIHKSAGEANIKDACRMANFRASQDAMVKALRKRVGPNWNASLQHLHNSKLSKEDQVQLREARQNKDNKLGAQGNQSDRHVRSHVEWEEGRPQIGH